MSNCSCHAIVHDGGWRERLWTQVFGKPEAPIVQPWPIEEAELAGERSRFVRLALKRVTEEQLQALARGIAEHFGDSPEEILPQMREVGMPIKCDGDVSLIGCQRHVLGMIL